MEVQIFEGDYVKVDYSVYNSLSSKIYSQIDKYDLSENEILLSLDKILVLNPYNAGMAEVLFINDKFSSTFLIDLRRDVLEVYREYKVLNLEENNNQLTGDTTLIAKLSSIDRVFHQTDEKTSWFNSFDPEKVNIFLIPLNSNLANSLLEDPEDNVLIQLSCFSKTTALFDGERKEVFEYI